VTQTEVKALCDDIAPSLGIDPKLALAICQQESAYNEKAMRLENGFLVRYVLPMNLASTVAGQFATSWGLMQMMGESLHELGYFSADQTPEGITKAINLYMITPRDQVQKGCEWFAKKLALARGDEWKALCYWNGDVDGTRGYANAVLAKMAKL